MMENLQVVLTEKFGDAEKAANIISFYYLLKNLELEAVREFYPEKLLNEYLSILIENKLINNEIPFLFEDLEKVSLINVEALRQFVVFGETGDFNKTTEQLNITTKVLNRGINSIEKQFKVKLIERKKHSKNLTGLGKTFLLKASKILNNLYNLEKIADLIYHRKKNENLFIHLTPAWDSAFLTDIFFNFKQKFPGSYFNISIGTKGTIEEALLLGETEIGLVGVKPVRSELDFIELIKIPAVIVCNPSEMKAWNEFKYITPKMQNNFSLVENLDLVYIVEVADLNLTLELCKRGPCAYLYQRTTVQEFIDNGTLAEVDCPALKDLFTTLYIIWNKNINLSPIARQFIFEIKQYFKTTFKKAISS